LSKYANSANSDDYRFYAYRRFLNKTGFFYIVKKKMSIQGIRDRGVLFVKTYLSASGPASSLYGFQARGESGMDNFF